MNYQAITASDELWTCFYAVRDRLYHDAVLLNSELGFRNDTPKVRLDYHPDQGF